MYSRRSFLKSGATVAAASLFPSSSLRASIATLVSGATQPSETSRTRRLANGWEFLQGSLGGPWRAWHSEEVAVWQPIAMPHCFNAYDGCDPDVPYYRGNGWYRTHVPIANPFKNDEPSCTLKALDRQPPCMSEKNLQASIRAATTSSSSTSQTSYPSPYRAQRRHRTRTLRQQRPNPGNQKAFPSRCSAITPAISAECPPISATSASTAAYTAMSIWSMFLQSLSKLCTCEPNYPRPVAPGENFGHRNTVQPCKIDRFAENLCRGRRRKRRLRSSRNQRPEALARDNGDNQLHHCRSPPVEPRRPTSLRVPHHAARRNRLGISRT